MRPPYFIFELMEINYHNKTFKSAENTPNGEVDASTLFHYEQAGDIVTGIYSGNQIKAGQLIATIAHDGKLIMRYQHINGQGELKYGHCITTPEELENGKLRLHEKWQWDCDDKSSGESILEEI